MVLDQNLVQVGCGGMSVENRFCHETETELKNLERRSQHVEDVEKLPFVTGEAVHQFKHCTRIKTS